MREGRYKDVFTGEIYMTSFASESLLYSLITLFIIYMMSMFIFLIFRFWGSFQFPIGFLVGTNTLNQASVDSKAGRRNSLYCLKDILNFIDTLSGEFLETQKLFPK